MTPGPPLFTSTFWAPILMVKTRSPFPTTLAASIRFLVWSLGLLLFLHSVPARADSRIDYNRDIRPILSENCYACHGPDPKARKADLRLDLKEDAFRDRSGFFVIVAGDPAVERAARTDRHGRPRRGDASPRVGQDVEQGPGRPGPQMDRARGPLGWALGLHPPGACRPPRGQGRDVAPQRDRPVRAEPDREGGALPLARGGQGDPHPSPEPRPHGTAADARGGGCVPGRYRPRRLREGGRSPPRLAPLRRADGAGLARPGALCRHEWLSHRQQPRHLDVSRMGDRGLQPEPAVRPVHRRADRRRPAPESDRGAADRDRLPAQHDGQLRGGGRRRRIPDQVRRRPREHDRGGLPGDDPRLRRVPRPQV